MARGEELILQEIAKRIDKLITVSGISFTDVAINRNALPIVVGTPVIGSLYLVQNPIKILFNTITQYPAGIYTKMTDTGSLNDWVVVPVKFDFKDNNFLLYDDGDSTKQAKFELTNLTQLRILTLQDKDITIAGLSDIPNASQIKILYESNTNTNAFTDNEKNKLTNLSIGVTEDFVLGIYKKFS